MSDEKHKGWKFVGIVIGVLLGLAASAAFFGWLAMLLLGIFGISVAFFQAWPAAAIVSILVRALFPAKR